MYNCIIKLIQSTRFSFSVEFEILYSQVSKYPNTLTNLIMYYRYSHNTTIFSVSNIHLRWVQQHVSALCIDHHQVGHRLVEQLYNKRGILGVWGVVGRDLVFIIVGGITLGFIKLPLNHLLH